MKTPAAQARNVWDVVAAIEGAWQPHRLASVNDYDVKVARFEGEFVRHSHPETDELFIVLEGRVTIGLANGDVELGPFDAFTVPRGVEHCPRSPDGAVVMLLEPRGTVNTGTAGGPLTAEVR